MSLTIDSSSRITGLASGLETDSIVEGLMATYQTRLDKQTQKTTKLEWTADAYREINTLIKNFRSKYLSVLSDTNLMSESAYGNYSVSMASTVSAVSVSASSSAAAGTYTIDSITQLAEAAQQSSSNVFTGTKYLSDTTLGSLELTNKFEFGENGELSFSINDKTFSFTKDTTVADLMKTVNSSGAGVTMRFSSLTKGFSITSNTTGSDSGFTIENLSGNAFAAENSATGIAQGTYSGKDAICTIEGVDVTQSTNSFTYDGITYTLNEKSDTPIKFSVDADYQKTVDNIVEFVDAYNELVSSLQSKVSEKVYYKYDPLTDDQKDEMEDDEIEKWEDYAKSGVLHNDSYVNSLLTTLRSSFYTAVEGTGKSLCDIGLTTGTYSDGAEITVDEDKLLAALKKDPEAVESMFVQTSKTDDFSGEGLMVRISEALLTYTQDTTDVALDSLDEQIAKSEDREDTLKETMDDKEEKLWAKFSEMEAALSKLNSMSTWLSSLFTT